MIKNLFCIAALLVMLALNACKSSDDTVRPQVVEDPPGAPPKTWLERGYPGQPTLNRVFYDDDIVIYYDKNMDPKVTWPYKFAGDMWRYAKNLYQVTPNERLYVTMHGKGGMGTVSYFYDETYDHHNTIICSSDSWEETVGWPHDLLTHEMFHIVETTSFGAHSNSAGYGDYPNGIWGDSQFAPIFQYDLYKMYGLENEAKRWEAQMNDSYSNHPTPYTYWGANWFLPIYKNYGKSEVLRGFFELVGQYFPEKRKLNMGEFVHFFSGAAHADLKSYAIKTFGWPDTFENELIHAKEEFPMITY